MPVEDLGGKAFIENYDLGCRMPRFFTFVTVAVKGKTDVDSSFFWKRYVFFLAVSTKWRKQCWGNLNQFFQFQTLTTFWSPPGFWWLFFGLGDSKFHIHLPPFLCREITQHGKTPILWRLTKKNAPKLVISSEIWRSRLHVISHDVSGFHISQLVM